MSEPADFLLELGTEELPPRALRSLSEALAENFTAALDAAGLAHGEVERFATPRRLALRVRGLARAQADQAIERRGPPVKAAFASDGSPTRAALAFAESCGVGVHALERLETERGAWLVHRAVQAGQPAASLLPALVEDALARLPIPRRMRWGSREAEFVRPVHWLVMMHGPEVVPGRLFELDAGRETRGHRFMAPEPLVLNEPGEYEARLQQEGRVIAHFGTRRARLLDACEQAARTAGGELVADEALLDEITALVEWPVALTAGFEAKYLALPAEVLIATLQGHQRYLPLRAPDGRLLDRFVTVANIESSQPEQVRRGNERVVRPRLADAAFFYAQDRSRRLETRMEQLDSVVFQRDLGSLRDKSLRVAAAAHQIAVAIGADAAMAERAAQLAKCDLVTEMVGEFPELQGRMGRDYAEHDGEPDDIATALEEQYLPRFAGDALPASLTGQTLALADRIDTLAGIFAIGQRPSGTRDPFGLRRAALGLLRMVIEHGLDLDVRALLGDAVARQPVATEPGLAGEVYAYVLDRLRGYYADLPGGEAITAEMLEAVLVLEPRSPLDAHRRLLALAEFLAGGEAAGSLAAANKRVANLLRKADGAGDAAVNPALLTEPAEEALHGALEAMTPALEAAAGTGDYAGMLATLSGLREPVDRFFDDVMVMAEQPDVRANRLALLDRLRAAFCRVADFSRLPG
jgi:glycyl-tRNA synthetase beta chain